MTLALSPKAEMRRAALARRAALDAEARKTFSERLLREGLKLVALHRPAAVSAFHPIRDEPDTLALLAAVAAQGIATAIPVTGRRGEPLVFRRWRPGEPTVPGQMRIPEPPPDAPPLDPDLLFAPLAAFDRRGHRIGYGAGHYDLTLERLRALKAIVAVGVAYGVCEVEAVPFEPHDQPLDYILTDSELISIKARR
jgi:5-formyltetrahydrofolate cyclo-ligase